MAFGIKLAKSCKSEAEDLQLDLRSDKHQSSAGSSALCIPPSPATDPAGSASGAAFREVQQENTQGKRGYFQPEMAGGTQKRSKKFPQVMPLVGPVCTPVFVM